MTNFLLHNYCYTNALVNDASLKPFQLQLFTASRFWQDKLRIFPSSFSLKISRIRNKYFLVNLVLGVLRHVDKLGLSSAHAIVSASFFTLEAISEDNERPVIVF